MGKHSYFPMEFSVFMMISVAIFLAYGDSTPVKSGNKSNEAFKSRFETMRDKELTDFSKEDVYTKNDLRFIPSVSATKPMHDKDKTADDETYITKRMNAKKQYNRKFKYDPALALMGLGKRNSQYDPALMYMGLGKRVSLYDPALKYMGLGKRVSQYDPALKYMGLGKRIPEYSAEHIEYEKRTSQYDPALKYMGLGKRDFQYDPALKYMGLGKRENSYDPGLMYMGLGKRNSPYDPGLKYMGLGKRAPDNRDSNYKSDAESSKDYEFIDDPENERMSLTELEKKHDISRSYVGLSKRNTEDEPVFGYVVEDEDKTDDDDSIPYAINFEEAPFNDYSQAVDNVNASKYSASSNLEMEKRGLRYNSRMPNRMINKEFITDKFENIPGLGKRPYKFDPALRLMGLGKRNDYSELGKRPYKYDPALNYMGLGKRKQSKSINTESQDSSLSNIFDGDDTNYMTLNLSNFRENKSSSNASEKLNDKLDYLMSTDDEKYFEVQREKRKGSSSLQKRYSPEVISMGMDKLTNKYYPSLLYRGLGKRKLIYDKRMYYIIADEDNDQRKNDASYRSVRLDKPVINNNDKIGIDIFQLSKHLNKTDDCDKCVKRKKRHAKSESQDISDIFPKKRESDYRPRYNPGWIFIGLGKRNENLKAKKNEIGYDTIKPSMSLDDYYVLLNRIKNSIENMKLKVADRRHGHSKALKKILLKVDPHMNDVKGMETEGFWHDEDDTSYIPDDTWLNALQKQ